MGVQGQARPGPAALAPPPAGRLHDRAACSTRVPSALHPRVPPPRTQPLSPLPCGSASSASAPAQCCPSPTVAAVPRPRGSAGAPWVSRSAQRAHPQPLRPGRALPPCQGPHPGTRCPLPVHSKSVSPRLLHVGVPHFLVSLKNYYNCLSLSPQANVIINGNCLRCVFPSADLC